MARTPAIPNGQVIMPTGRILGRTTSGNGSAEALTIGAGLTLSNGTLLATGGSGSAQTGWINFRDAGGVIDDPTAAAANLTLIHTLIDSVTVPNPAAPHNRDYWAAGPRIYFPPGAYHFSGPIRLKKAVYLMGSTGATRSFYNTIFHFPSNSQGIVVDNWDTDNHSYVYQANRTTGANGSVIEGLALLGSSTSRSDSHGIFIRTVCHLKNVHVKGFGGHGIYVCASLGNTGYDGGGNASNCTFTTIGVQESGRSGLCINGSDANVIQVTGGDFVLNGDWGIEDNSGLGCSFDTCHTSQNGALYAPHRGGNHVLVMYNGVMWAARADSSGWSTTVPGTNENVWTRHYEGINDWVVPNWYSGIPVRPGGAYVTYGQTAWSVWKGMYTEGGQPPAQTSYRAIVIGGDHGSSLIATNNYGTGKPVWMDAHNGELDLKGNMRLKALSLGQTKNRNNGGKGLKMTAAASKPDANTAPFPQVSSYMDYSFEPGDIVWNQSPSSATDKLGWRCTGGPTDFVEIPWPSSGAGGGLSDGDKGDITVSNSGATWTIDSGVITLNKLSPPTYTSFIGATGSGAWDALTTTQATSILNTFTSSAKGLVPASGGGNINFLRADGTWAAPSSGGGGSVWSVNDVTDGSAALQSHNNFANQTHVVLGNSDNGSYYAVYLSVATVGKQLKITRRGTNKILINFGDNGQTLLNAGRGNFIASGGTITLTYLGSNRWAGEGDFVTDSL